MSFGSGGSGGNAIATDDDVALNNPADGQVLGYNGGAAKWQNSVPTATDTTAVHKGDLLLDIRDYGASTGATNNKSAIDAAITAAAATGGVVFFPAGAWKTTGGHNIPLNVSVQGAGKGVTLIDHHGVGTYCFFIGSTSGGPQAPSYLGKVGNFSLQGQSGGDGTGSFGQQIGITVLNCLFFNVYDVHASLLYKAFLFDGGDETALGAGTFAGNGYVANCTTTNVFIGFHIARWVTDTLYSFIYCYGAGPIKTGSVGIWIDVKASTSTFLNSSAEGIDTGMRIATSRGGLCFVNPRLENCNTYVDWQNDSYDHVVIGGSVEAGIWAKGANAGKNTQISREGFFPEVTSLPVASAAAYKSIYRVLGSGGVADSLNICTKDASGNYVWCNLLAAASGSGSTGLLAAKSYNPASITSLSSTANTTTFQDIDATNLAVTFMAPASGQVLLRLTGLVSRTGTSANTDVYWNVRDSSGDVSGVGARVLTSTGSYLTATTSQVISGLVPNQSYTWKWGHRTATAGADWQANLRVGGSVATAGYGPATMEIWST